MLTEEELKVKELQLKVRELELKVGDMERPSYRKLGTWTSVLAILIAIVSVGAQNAVSHNQDILYKIEGANAKKELDSAKANVANKKKELDSANVSVANKKKELDSATANLGVAHDQYDSLLKQIDVVNKSLVILGHSNANVDATQKREINSLITQTQNIIAPRIYIQIPGAAQLGAAQKLRDKLKAYNFIIPGIENVTGKAISPAKCDVRYYRDEERGEALKIIELLKDANIGLSIRNEPVKVKNGTARPRHYEVWLSKS
ncbi:MAG: hypothetical protein JWQ38_1333 [Flavipsychrobacter sp.]|nr:hypothetical protein [Flavipsychrobacter sp.]